MRKDLPTITITGIDFNPLMKILEKKHGFDHRDFLGKFSSKNQMKEVEYLDFWHWCLDHPFQDLHRGGFNYLSIDYLTDEETPAWVKTILKYIFDAVEGHPAFDGEHVCFLVDW